jgi:hypothetical protein
MRLALLRALARLLGMEIRAHVPPSAPICD